MFLAKFQIVSTEKFPDRSWRVKEVSIGSRVGYTAQFFNHETPHGPELFYDTLEKAKSVALDRAVNHDRWPEGQKAITWVRPPYCGHNAIVK